MSIIYFLFLLSEFKRLDIPHSQSIYFLTARPIPTASSIMAKSQVIQIVFYTRLDFVYADVFPLFVTIFQNSEDLFGNPGRVL